MAARLEDFIDGLTAISDVEATWEKTLAFGRELGFSNLSMNMARHSGSGCDLLFVKSSLGAEFSSVYENEGLYASDPFLHVACRSLNASMFHPGLLSKSPGATREHRIFLDLVATYGARSALGIPVSTVDQQRFGGFLMSIDGGESDLLRVQGEAGRDAHLACLLAHERMTALDPGRRDGDGSPLSPRERECMLWLCAGLRVGMIADKLSIGESAVNLYITNAKSKLGAKTREQAVARAIFSGAIRL